jgi:hypothetical protein
MGKGDFDNYSVEAFVPNACFFGIPVLAVASTRYTCRID